MALSHEERQLITELFERMQETGAPDKDPEAEALINQLARRTPDSLYILVQTALIQEAQLQDSDAQLEDMQARIDELEQQLSGGRQQSRSGGGGFLGGARRGPVSDARDYEPERNYQPERGSSVPPIGSRGSASTYDSGRASQPWSSRTQEPVRDAGRGPMGAPPMQQAPQQAQTSGGGGFLKTAAAMAAGVAGGALLGNALGGMFGGGGNKGGEAQAGQAGQSSQGNEPTYQNADDNDPGNTDSNVHDAGYEGGDWGAGGGDDLEI